jgi:hypothetical protein
VSGMGYDALSLLLFSNCCCGNITTRQYLDTMPGCAMVAEPIAEASLAGSEEKRGYKFPGVSRSDRRFML